ncbi:hypothetical protein CAPTEDRAFT_214964 [Capitella teleta]|uniref:MATH domain-containing protein n=1 Tax=Capitella teleta TaxID=283909 RepID=R7TEA1_CAPTE|nr:hypothetical protein CAPTEDRAFT_214964 [Capitella teleta]|eukprot:ELT89797.1 hypothetical protein CAPTEDRAFT_214964 [Capitella teleta]
MDAGATAAALGALTDTCDLLLFIRALLVQLSGFQSADSQGNRAMNGFAYQSGNMARMFRLVKLHDRFDTEVFSFQLPASILREFSPDVLSREFTYGHQKWSISILRGEHHIGAYLNVKNLSEGMWCTVDYSFTLVNSDHFTRNDSFLERGCTFSAEGPSQGRRNFVGVKDLRDRKFVQENGEFILELEMRNMLTFFHQAKKVQLLDILRGSATYMVGLMEKKTLRGKPDDRVRLKGILVVYFQYMPR